MRRLNSFQSLRIALTTGREDIDQYGEEILVFEENYPKYFQKHDIQLLVVPSSCKRLLHKWPMCDFILLTGGGDVPNMYYKDYTSVSQQENRDSLEADLLTFAESNAIPVLGICRGMQFINGYYGGKVRHDPCDNHKPGEDHVVITNEKNMVVVNSYHNDVVLPEDLAPGFKSIAIHEKLGTVEAFVSKEKRILGIQWHPERGFSTDEGYYYTNHLINDFLSRELFI